MAYDLSKLTVRQREAYELARDGKSIKESAESLNISISGVKHLRNVIYRKLGIRAFSGSGRRIEPNYQDSLKDTKFECLLAIASLSQRVSELEAANHWAR